MKFARAIWSLLVGIKDALVLVFMLLFFGLLYAGLSARPQPIGDGILAMKLEGTVVEQPARPQLTDLAGGSVAKQHSVRELVAALDAARDDERVKAVALDLEAFTGGGQAAMGDLAEAIGRVRNSGKPVVAYAVGYTDGTYQVASAASEIWLNPLGAVVIAGPGGSNLYYKGLLDKLGVTANIYRVGAFKSAVEPYMRNDMSAEARANYQALTGALFESWREEVGRTRPKAKLDAYVGNIVGAVNAAGGDMAAAALNGGLVDRLGERRDFERRLAELGGEDESSAAGFKQIKLASYVSDVIKDDADAPIGVVTIAGTIIDGKAPLGTAGGDSIAQMIDKALRQDDLKALVVRVDSPGGSVLASERIRQALLAAKADKLPVVVSMGNVAASGGYWVSTPADFIYAEPSTITGSIGVFGVLPSFEGTLEKLGLGADGVKTTPLSGEPDLLRGPAPEVNQLIQTGVESTYRRFINLVAQSRNKSPQQIHQIAQGRVWDGGSARQLGLVDGFGGMEEAIAKAAELAKLDQDNRSVRYLTRPTTWEEQLVDMLSGGNNDETTTTTDAFKALSGRPEEQLQAAVAELRWVLSGPTIQARCLGCPAVATAAPAARRGEGLLATLGEWLF